ncbi:hypothetical protein GOODEAATRI_005051 [Goodea atripinnis]|uniref:Uncharacterized protein n=1 Tax=Goodea atripinnis TaxID=208336 RepID=A0ABV0PW60_9TELE
MNGLLCCAEILAMLLFIPWSVCETPHSATPELTVTSQVSNTSAGSFSNHQTTIATSSPSVRKTALPPTTCQCVQTNPATTTSPWTVSYLKHHCPMMLISCGTLILACTILLISTLMLAWKVCQLRRCVSTLGGKGTLVSNSEYWMGMDKKNKAESQPEAKENSFLLTENSQTNQEIDNNATKEDGGKVGEDGQNGEEKKVGDGQETKEAATLAATEESSPSSKAVEEATSSENTTAPPPLSSSEDTEEPKKEP